MHGLSSYYLLLSHENYTALIFLLDRGGGRLKEKYTDRQLEWVRTVAQDEYPGALGIVFAHIPSESVVRVSAGQDGGA